MRCLVTWSTLWPGGHHLGRGAWLHGPHCGLGGTTWAEVPGYMVHIVARGAPPGIHSPSNGPAMALQWPSNGPPMAIWGPLEGEWSTPEGAWRDRGGRVSTGGDPFAFQSPSNGPPMAPQWPSNGLPMAMWGPWEGEWNTPEGAWRDRGEVPGYMVHIVAWGAPPGVRCLVTWSTLWPGGHHLG